MKKDVQWKERKKILSPDEVTTVSFNGSPFFILGRRMYECVFGTPRSVKKDNEEVPIVKYRESMEKWYGSRVWRPD